MAQNNKGLGRGLDALFHQTPPETFHINSDNGDTPFILISPNMLFPNPSQPRVSFSEDSLQELASSMRAQGMLQPVLVRPANEDGMYQIIAGERRWRASKLAGLAQIPAQVRNLDDKEVMVVALMENMQREDLNPLEEAKGLQALRDALDLTQEELADKVGRTRSAVSNCLRLLKLDPEAQEDLLKGRLSMGQARTLLAVPDREAADVLRQRIISTGMTVRKVEQAINFWHATHRFPWEKPTPDPNAAPTRNFARDPDILRVAKALDVALNCRTRISGSPAKGKISLTYESNEQFFALLEKLGLNLGEMVNAMDKPLNPPDNPF